MPEKESPLKLGKDIFKEQAPVEQEEKDKKNSFPVKYIIYIILASLAIILVWFFMRMVDNV